MTIFDMIIVDGTYAAENVHMADSSYIAEHYHLNNNANELQNQQEITIKSMEKLANRKKMILSTSIKNFIGVYEKLMTIEFNESDTMHPLNHNDYENNIIDDLRSMVVTSGYTMNYNQTIYTYLVGSLLDRSFLDENAKIIHKKSAPKQHVVTLDSFYMRSERLSVLLAHLNLHFRKHLDATADIFVKNGNDRSNYSNEEKHYIRNCLKIAEIVKLIIDTPLIDDTGVLSEKSLEALRVGNDCLIQLNTVTIKC